MSNHSLIDSLRFSSDKDTDMTPDQFSAPDPAQTAIETAAQSGYEDFPAYSTAVTEAIVSGSQAVENQVLSDFAETVSNTPQAENE
jgi:hypothetical protein